MPTFHTPRHGTDESFRRRRRSAELVFQQLRHEGRIVGNPVAHDNLAAGFRDPHHLLCDIEGLWGQTWRQTRKWSYRNE